MARKNCSDAVKAVLSSSVAGLVIRTFEDASRRTMRSVDSVIRTCLHFQGSANCCDSGSFA